MVHGSEAVNQNWFMDSGAMKKGWFMDSEAMDQDALAGRLRGKKVGKAMNQIGLWTLGVCIRMFRGGGKTVNQIGSRFLRL